MKNWFLIDIFYGLYQTLHKLFEKKVTVLYPEQKKMKPSRFRGELALREDENGYERCIGCKLCEAICPAKAIKIDIHETAEGERKPKIFDIDMTKCIYCGLCEQACPVDAIVLTQNMEFYGETLADLYYNKQKLLENGKKWESLIIENLKDNERFK